MSRKRSTDTPITIVNIIKVMHDNFIETDINEMFYPMHLMFAIILSSKYNLQGNLIIPNGVKYHVTMCVMLLFGSVFSGYQLYGDIYYDEKGLKLTTDRIVTTIFFYVYYCICLHSVYIINMVKRHSNVLLVLIVKNIHCNIANNINVKRFISWNWFLSIFIISLDVGIYVTVFTYNVYYSVWDLVFDYLFTAVNMNMIYATFVITLLTEYVTVWKNNITIMNPEQGNEEFCNKMFNVYKNILEAFNVCKELFQLVICLSTVDLFTRALCYIAVAIDSLTPKQSNTASAYGDFDTYVIITSMKLIWLLKDCVLNIALNISCEKFYIAIEDAVFVCTGHIKTSNVHHKRLCKNVIRLHRASFSKMTACGFFTVDAVLPLSLLALLTNYICVLLQFALHL